MITFVRQKERSTVRIIEARPFVRLVQPPCATPRALHAVLLADAHGQRNANYVALATHIRKSGERGELANGQKWPRLP